MFLLFVLCCSNCRGISIQRHLHGLNVPQPEQADWISPIETIKEPFGNKVKDVSHQYDRYAGKLRDQDKYIEGEFDQMKGFSAIRRVKRSEVIDSDHVRMKEMSKLRYKRNDEFQQRQIDRVVTDVDTLDADTSAHALKVFHMAIVGAVSQRRTEHGPSKTTILDSVIAFAHTLAAVTDTEELSYAHSPREDEPDCTVVWSSLKAYYRAR